MRPTRLRPAAFLAVVAVAIAAALADDKPKADNPPAPGAADTKPNALDNLKVGVEAKTPGGVTVVMTEESKAQTARDGDWVWVHYTGKLSTGEQFDSSAGGKPIRFQIGKPGIIQGWSEGITGMKVGEKRRLTIPPALAYGAEGRPPKIPANSTLVFDVELVGLAHPD